MNVSTALPPRSPGNNWAYWKVNDLRLDRLQDTWKRRRNRISFIPTPEAFKYLKKTDVLICPVCEKQVTAFDASPEGKGVRGVYLPRLKAYALGHYVCSWQNLMEGVFKTGRAKNVGGELF